jgi:hypothetical protein
MHLHDTHLHVLMIRIVHKLWSDSGKIRSLYPSPSVSPPHTIHAALNRHLAEGGVLRLAATNGDIRTGSESAVGARMVRATMEHGALQFTFWTQLVPHRDQQLSGARHDRGHPVGTVRRVYVSEQYAGRHCQGEHGLQDGLNKSTRKSCCHGLQEPLYQ